MTSEELNQIGIQVQALQDSLSSELEGVEQSVLEHEIKLDDLDADYQETDRSIRAFMARVEARLNDIHIRLAAIEEDLRG